MKTRLILAFLLVVGSLSCNREDIVPVSGIQLSLKSVYVKVGESILVNAAIDPLNASDSRLTWLSRSENIATVDASGNLHGVAFGNTYILVTAIDGNFIDSCEVFVNGTLTGSAGHETITLSNGYANDVYYSLTNGVVATVPRTNWDIAFMTGSRTSTIIINAGAGIKLYTYPDGNISDWANVTTAGLSSWKPMNNSDTTWSLGAFERNALGHPDYGWGIYNTVSHDVVGDSIFVIQLKDQSLRKLSITKKVSVENKYIFRFAGIDGSNQVIDTVDCNPYTSKNFIYYSFDTHNVIDREPSKDSWDFLVTKYIEMIPDGSGGRVPYPVIGVLTNSGIRSATLDNVDVTTTDYSSASFVSSVSEIGSDWKSYSMTLNQWTLKSNRVYFVRDRNMYIYKVVFTGFAGSGTGILEFEKAKLN